MVNLLAAVVCLLALVGVANAATNVSSCTTINSPGVYVLNTSILSSGASRCIQITSSDVIFDGSGYTIDGVDGTNTYGVYVYSASGLTNVTVKNLKLSDWYYGIYFSNVQNGSMENSTANSNSYSIYVVSSTNISVLNNTIVSTGSYAVSYISTNSGALRGNIITSNGNIGFYIQGSNNLTIANNTISSNSGTGIELYGSSNNNVIENNTIASNGFAGIRLITSHNNTVVNCNISKNSGDGVYTFGQNNTIANNTLSLNSGDGVELAGDGNIVANNTITQNNNYGVYVRAKNNLIYNNFFNNSNNIAFGSGAGANSWNTTKQAGKNIVGGSYIAGNAWLTPAGDGFSQTCSDSDADGICDSAYTLATDNVDYLPLVYDAEPPSVAVNSPQNKTYGTSTIEINVSASDPSGVSSVVAEIDGSQNVSLSLQSGYYVNSVTLSDGQHSIRIYANDSFGNMNASEVVYFSVDTTPPSVSIISPKNTTYSSAVVQINVSVSDPGGISNVIAEIDSTTNVTLTFSNGYYVGTTPALPAGGHNIRIYASDTYGNVNASEVVYFTVAGGISSCTNITQAGYYYLANDIVNSSAKVCILINASDVILDGRGHAIDGVNDTTNETKGIWVVDVPNVKGHVNVTIRNLTVKEWKYGILLELSNQSKILDITTRSNDHGIYMPGSNNNTVANSTIAWNYVEGIWVLQASDNLIYNNLFNNSVNAELTFAGSNAWNITKTPGTNIVGGSYLGGNYWGKPDGTGFSDTCNDGDGDGICDSALTLDSGNVDYLPLAKPVVQPPDTTPPVLTFVSPTPANGSVRSYLYINVTSSESLSSAWVEVWTSTTPAVNISLLGSGTGWYLNLTTLADATYHYRVWGNDSAGNVGNTEVRVITIDTSAPGIAVAAPPYVLQYLGSAEVNFTLSDANPASYTLLRNGTIIASGSYSSGDVVSASVPSANLGVWNFTLIANDSAGNVNSSTVFVQVVPAEAEVNKTITGAPIEVNETLANASTSFEILPDANTGKVTLKVRLSRNATELESNTSNAEFASYAVSAGHSSPDMYIRVEVSGDVNATALRYVVVRLSYTIADLDRNGDGDANDVGDIDEDTLTLWRYCSAGDEWQELKPGNITCGNATITVFASGVNTSERYVWANLSRLSVFAIGGNVIKPVAPAALVPAVGAYSPEAVLLASSIDLALASDLVSYLEERGIKLYIVDAQNFSEYSNKQYIIILGGHRAYEGVGDIVAGILSEEEKRQVEEGRAYIKKRSVFRAGQVVYIFAGKDRHATAEAWREAHEEVAREIEYNWG